MEIGIGDIKRELASSLLKLKHAKRDGNAQRTNVLMSKIEACFGELEKYKLLSINDIDFLAESKRKYNLFLKEQVDTARSEQADAGDIKEIGISSSPPTEQLPEIINKHQQTIDVERLKAYFISKFNSGVKLQDGGEINYFELFVEELKIERIPKEFAQIALMCYEGSVINAHKKGTFQHWYRIFCEYVGCPKMKYDKNKLKSPKDTLRAQFNYLK